MFANGVPCQATRQAISLILKVNMSKIMHQLKYTRMQTEITVNVACSSWSGKDNIFNIINLQQDFCHITNYDETSQSRDRSNSKKPFKGNNDYHSPDRILNLSDVDIPATCTNDECEFVNLNSISLRLNQKIKSLLTYINISSEAETENNGLEAEFLLDTRATSSLISLTVKNNCVKHSVYSLKNRNQTPLPLTEKNLSL